MANDPTSSPESPPPPPQSASAPMLTPPTSYQKYDEHATSASTSTASAAASGTAGTHLPPRKRIHSLKKQFTKPNLEAPMIPALSASLPRIVPLPPKHVTIAPRPAPESAAPPTLPPAESADTTQNALEKAILPEKPKIAESDAQKPSVEAKPPPIPPQPTMAPMSPPSQPSITAVQQQLQQQQQPASPFIDIESGDTTETDEDEWHHTKTETVTPDKLRQTVIIQQPSAPQPPQPPKTPQSGNATPSMATSIAEQPPPAPVKPKKQSKKAKKDQGEETTKGKRKRARSTSSKNQQPSEQQQQMLEPQDKSADEKPKKKGKHLYCICRKPYEASQFMIACDRCDQWFHGACIGINEKDGEFIDLYFCDKCSKETGKSTSWKPKCGNPACDKAGRVSTHQGYVSKYCSHNCGMQVARARLELADMKRKRHVLTHGLKDDASVVASIPELVVHRQRQVRLASYSEHQDARRLQAIKENKKQALDRVHMIEFKKDFLQSLPTQDDTCGFDPRLVLDDDAWMEAWQKQSPPPVEKEPCTIGRKQCHRHAQWAKVAAQVMDLERQEQLHILQRLHHEKHLIQSRQRQRRDQVHLAQAVAHGVMAETQK
ncbi:hypothetical protein BC940DRAFT_291894 [Gongronella butleri]|nr:hypothetical protein BC940DRAFT_291894 [Gongronella butleri]